MEYTTSTTIKISFMIFGQKHIIFEVRWINTVYHKDDTTRIDGSTTNNDSISYVIMGLEEDSSYTITVTAINVVGSAVSVPVTARTMKAGELHTF